MILGLGNIRNSLFMGINIRRLLVSMMISLRSMLIRKNNWKIIQWDYSNSPTI